MLPGQHRKIAFSRKYVCSEILHMGYQIKQVYLIAPLQQTNHQRLCCLAYIN